MNPLRGETPFGDTGLALQFSTNAICEFETALGQKFIAAIKALDGGEPGFVLMRLLVWAGLRAARPDLSVEGAGDLIDSVGLKPAMEAVGVAVRAAFPDAEGPPEKH